MQRVEVPTAANADKLIRKLSGPDFVAAQEKKEQKDHFLYIMQHTVPMIRKIKGYDKQALSALRDRALFLIGDYDRIAYQPAFIQAYQDLQLPYKIIHGVDHMINHEKPERINREIIEFLSE